MKIDYNDSVNMNCLMQTMYFLVEEVEHWILRHDEPSDYNWGSFAQAIEVGAWAQEFEEAWRTLGMEDELNVDYPYMICAYAERKCKAYFGDWPESKQEPKTVSEKPFGVVCLYNEDIEQALHDEDFLVTEETVSKVRAACEADPHFTDAAVSAGWDAITNKIYELESKNWNN